MCAQLNGMQSLRILSLSVLREAWLVRVWHDRSLLKMCYLRL